MNFFEMLPVSRAIKSLDGLSMLSVSSIFRGDEGGRFRFAP
jgi:hypothetical protein